MKLFLRTAVIYCQLIVFVFYLAVSIPSSHSYDLRNNKTTPTLQAAIFSPYDYFVKSDSTQTNEKVPSLRNNELFLQSISEFFFQNKYLTEFESLAHNNNPTPDYLLSSDVKSPPPSA